MRILCPLCGFGREVDLAKIPPRAQMATCPRCEHKFRFRVVDDLPPTYSKPAERTPLATRPSDLRPEPSSPLRSGQDLSSRSDAASGTPTDRPAGQDPMAAQRAAAELAWKHLQGVKPEAPKTDAPGIPASAGPASDAPASDAPSSDATRAAGPALGGQQPDAPTYLNVAPASVSSPVPFENLPTHGFFPGLWRTITEILKTPTAFFSVMPVTGGMAKPLIFHLLLAEFMVLCQFLWGVSGITALSQYSGSQELMDLGLGLTGTSPIFILVLYPLLLILRLMLMTGVIHFLLRAIFRFTGGQGSGAEATFRVLCYSAAPLILGVIPFFGPLLGGVWSIGLTIIGLKEAHRTSGSAATFAVMLPILLLLAAALGLMQAGLKG